MNCQIVEFGYMESKNFTSETPLRIEFTTGFDDLTGIFHTFYVIKVLRNWVSQNNQGVPKQPNLRYVAVAVEVILYEKCVTNEASLP